MQRYKKVRKEKKKDYLIKQVWLLVWTSDKKITLYEKEIWFCERKVIATEKCIAWKKLIEILFINDFEVI